MNVHENIFRDRIASLLAVLLSFFFNTVFLSTIMIKMIHLTTSSHYRIIFHLNNKVDTPAANYYFLLAVTGIYSSHVLCVTKILSRRIYSYRAASLIGRYNIPFNDPSRSFSSPESRVCDSIFDCFQFCRTIKRQ